VRSKIAGFLAALGLVFGAVSYGDMEDTEDQQRFAVTLEHAVP
jgi:hypothetical protein